MAVLSLSLTSCGRAATLYGATTCDQTTLGDFDIYVIPVDQSSGVYQISVIPAGLFQQQEIVTIAVADSQNPEGNHQVLIEQTALSVDQETVAGLLTASALNQFDTLVMGTSTPGVPFINSSPARVAVCSLPLPNIRR